MLGYLMRKAIILCVLSSILVSCGPLYYGYLPGSDYKLFKPQQDIDLKGKTFNLEFRDDRGELNKIECSEHKLNRETELEGEPGFTYYKEYVKTMIEHSNGKIDSESSNKIMVDLQGLSFRLVGAFFIVAHGYVQFKVSSPLLEKTYCSDMTDHDEDAPLKWYSFVTRQSAARLIVSGSMRRVVENFTRDLTTVSPLSADKFFERIEEGDTKAVQSMIAAGMDPNVLGPDITNGTTALQAALGHIETMKVLIAAGADVNATNKYGSTSLIWAAHFGQTEAAQVLLASGADVNLKNQRGITPLMDAAIMGHPEIVELLLAKGADVNATLKDGWTALMLAAGAGYTQVVQLLLAAGANMNAKTKDGKTALSIAAEEGHTDIVQLLKKAGAVK